MIKYYVEVCMSRYRRTSKKSKYYLDDELYDTVLHYARNYPTWLAEYSVYDPHGAIRYDRPRVQTSGDYDPTETLGIRHAALKEKIDKIESAAKAAAPEETLRKFLVLGVCYGLTGYQLAQRNMPCTNREYSAMRSKFFYELAQIL